MEIILQKQTEKTGCVSACLAMLMARPVDEVTNEFHSLFQLRMEDIDTYAAKYGLELEQTEDRSHLNPGHVYLLMVPSLNSLGLFHEIVLDYRDEFQPKLFDPSNHQTYSVDAVDPGETQLVTWVVDYVVVRAPALGIGPGVQ